MDAAQRKCNRSCIAQICCCYHFSKKRASLANKKLLPSLARRNYGVYQGRKINVPPATDES
jgi:hypothetical protein